MLDLVENLFSRYGIRNLRYDGSMTRENRERAIIEFRHAGSPKVILIRFVAFRRFTPCPSADDCAARSLAVLV